jgi:hypothetical protein
MKGWVWVLAVSDNVDSFGSRIEVFPDQKQAQTAFKGALSSYGHNRRYDIRLAFVKSAEKYLSAHPEYRAALG